MTMRTALLLFVSALLAGCGSQNDAVDITLGDSAGSGPAGIYEARLSSSTENREEDWVFVLAPRRPMGEDPRIAGYMPADPQRVMVGRYRRGPGQTLTGALRLYDVIEVERPVLDEEGEETEETETVLRRRVRPLSITGIFSPAESLSVFFSGQGGNDAADAGDGSISGSYRERLSERPSRQERMVSGWRRTDEFGSDVVTFNIGPDAGIAGNAPDPVSEQLCRYDGRFALINAAFNIYEISFDQSQCGGDPDADEAPPLRTMFGLAFLDDFVREEDEELARPRELVFIMGSAPIEDGSAEARVYELRRRTGL
ncbi:hypothetical protein [Algiphilus aromaticivorans]|uniref:hypothetical protein n=1 Tax=Algiphilus aromaticivorans TaxID=382454 RepID=UPI0005C1433A|nr:hypothetical protein [Algiphilus aromaticivorans]